MCQTAMAQTGSQGLCVDDLPVSVWIKTDMVQYIHTVTASHYHQETFWFDKLHCLSGSAQAASSWHI
jgi:hypothetical protein